MIIFTCWGFQQHHVSAHASSGCRTQSAHRSIQNQWHVIWKADCPRPQARLSLRLSLLRSCGERCIGAAELAPDDTRQASKLYSELIGVGMRAFTSRKLKHGEVAKPLASYFPQKAIQSSQSSCCHRPAELELPWESL